MISSLNKANLSFIFHTSPFFCYLFKKIAQRGLSTIPFNNIDQLIHKKLDIEATFRKQGYLILSAPPTDRQLLFDVARLFGKIQGHVRSPQDGIVEIQNKVLQSQNKQVSSDFHFVAHTDGHYLEGLASQKGKTLRIIPPKIIALQCIKPAIKGGVNFLVDGKAILLSMIKNHSYLLPTLFAHNCTSICRGDLLAINLPVLKKMHSGRFSLRFSYDQDLYAPTWAKKSLDFFNKHYVSNPAFATFLSLSAKQILILDNHRYLHGRTEINGERLFRRIWVQDESLSTTMHLLQKKNVPYYTSNKNPIQALAHYQPYTAIDDLKKALFEKILVGIELPSNINSRIEKILQSTTNF
jgi:hypothetical protein